MMITSLSLIRRMSLGNVLALLILVGCGPVAGSGSPDASGDSVGSASEAMTSAPVGVGSDSDGPASASDRAATRDAAPTARNPNPGERGPTPSQASPAATAARTEIPVTPTSTPTPDSNVRREPPPTYFSGYPCDPYIIAGLEGWVWENTVRWQRDGSAVFFSQGPVVYGAAADGAWARAVADATGRVNPRLTWHPRVHLNRVEVGPMTYFDISPDGERLVYATCAFREEAVTSQEQDSAERVRQSFLSQGYDPQSTGPFVLGYELAVVGLDEGPVERLTRNVIFDNYPVWSPDGTRLAYLAGGSVRAAVLRITTATGGEPRRIDTGEHILGLHPPQWAPDGTRLAVVGTDDSPNQLAVLTVNADGGDLQRLGRTISGPTWSPDGTRLAFVGATDDQDDAWDLLTMAADGTDVRRLPLAPDWVPHYVGRHAILTGLTEDLDGWIPTLAWSPAGDQLLYTCGLRICVVALDGTPVGQSPRAWDSGSVAAWSPDGGRIAVAAGVIWGTKGWDMRSAPALYTMAPDGTDVRMLAVYDAEGAVRPMGLRPADGRVDVTGCAAEVAVADPAANPGLVRDCETLLRVQAAWARELGWSDQVPIQEWAGVTVDGSPRRVRELQVNRQALGPIPPALGALDQLEILVLGGGGPGRDDSPGVGWAERVAGPEPARGVPERDDSVGAWPADPAGPAELGLQQPERPHSTGPGQAQRAADPGPQP